MAHPESRISIANSGASRVSFVKGEFIQGKIKCIPGPYLTAAKEPEKPLHALCQLPKGLASLPRAFGSCQRLWKARQALWQLPKGLGGQGRLIFALLGVPISLPIYCRSTAGLLPGGAQSARFLQVCPRKVA